MSDKRYSLRCDREAYMPNSIIPSNHASTSRPMVPAAPRRPANPESELTDVTYQDEIEPSDVSHAETTSAASQVSLRSALHAPAGHNDAVSLRQAASRPASTTSRSGQSQVTDFNASVLAAQAKGLAALTIEVTHSTKIARGIVSKMTIAGLGVSLGLLFAGQPYAVVLVVPAMAAIGVGIRWALKKRLNSGSNPNIEAFKNLMANADEQTKALPQYAHALKLYKFLGAAPPSESEAHLSETFAPLAQSTTSRPGSVASLALTVENLERHNVSQMHLAASAAPSGASGETDSIIHVYMEPRKSESEASLPLSFDFNKSETEGSVSPSSNANKSETASSPRPPFDSSKSETEGEIPMLFLTNQNETVRSIPIDQAEMDDKIQIDSNPNLEQTRAHQAPEHQANLSPAAKLVASSFVSKDAMIADWHAKNPGVDPTHSFDERDIESYDSVMHAIVNKSDESLVPVWSASEKVSSALQIDPNPRARAYTASQLRSHLGLKPSPTPSKLSEDE